jgi:hypothetical protein
MPGVSMVHVQDPRVRWSVHAAGVVRIMPAAEWSATATPPVDVLAGLGPVPRSGSRGRRVVVVRDAHGRETALLAAGAIDVGDVDPAAVLPLPASLAGAAPQIAAIIAWHDASLSLLLELAAVTTPVPVVGEDLCPSRS